MDKSNDVRIGFDSVGKWKRCKEQTSSQTTRENRQINDCNASLLKLKLTHKLQIKLMRKLNLKCNLTDSVISYVSGVFFLVG